MKTLNPLYESVAVELGDRSYEIHLAASDEEADAAWSAAIAGLRPLSHAVLIVDEAVAATVAAPLADRLRTAGVRCESISVPSGESSKSVDRLAAIWESMLAAGADRKSVVFAVGGGVIGDLAGFAAATFMRGLRFVQVPTTLLAMVDSSVGGKTGINMPSAKNAVGAFWQPAAVTIDLRTLSTLPEREFRSGFAEVVKYGVIMERAFFESLERNSGRLVKREAAALREAVAWSCRCKAEVVRDDERETTGRRAILNYGHTFAHALETTAGYGSLLHGEAVSIGMRLAARLAVHLGMLDAGDERRQRQLLEAFGLPVEWKPLDLPALWEVMRRDKKVEHGRLGFILPTRLGEVTRVEGVELSTLETALG